MHKNIQCLRKKWMKNYPKWINSSENVYNHEKIPLCKKIDFQLFKKIMGFEKKKKLDLGSENDLNHEKIVCEIFFKIGAK